MPQPAQRLVLAGLLLGALLAPASAAEREDVRKVINLVTSVKMPFPEHLTWNRAKTERAARLAGTSPVYALALLPVLWHSTMRRDGGSGCRPGECSETRFASYHLSLDLMMRFGYVIPSEPPSLARHFG
jgi:hypothetical protein